MSVQQCSHCGSFDIVAGTDHLQCLECGFHTDFTGDKSVPPSSYDKHRKDT